MIKVKITLSILAVVVAYTASAQIYNTTKSFIEFYSHSPLEDIKAQNHKGAAVCNTAANTLAFSVPIAEFQFEKSLMKDHFNEKYLETEKFPKSTFTGMLSSLKKEPGIQQVTAKGKLTIHGVSKDVEIPGTIEWIGEQLNLKSKFIVVLEDYKIIRPQLLWQNLAEQIEVTIDFTLNPKR